ncbi:MAG TPA: NADH-quinone oxidoreductase subunit L [Terriglobia bacterium]|nr:NADH-quinone oxidoreductase subunit L [Terriglobia bacterium]
METLLLLILLPPLAGVALNGIFGRRFSNGLVSWIACGASGLSLIFALLAAWTYTHLVTSPAPFSYRYFTWIQSGNFTADFALYYDRLTLVMTFVVTFVGFLIHLYSRGYMEHEGGYYRFFAEINLFLFMMLLLVTAANYPLMFVGWEGVGLCSYLLIGFYFPKKSASDAGKKAFVVTRIGDGGFTVGVALLFWTLGTLGFEDVFGKIAQLPPGDLHGVLTAIGLLFFLGAVGKSAQIPLYVWLPDAMEGPTPVSALIHAATMVTAGVYLVARSNILFAHAPLALEVVAVIGVVTAFYAATIALCQNDLKRMLAYSTISQLGYMFLACGAAVFASGIFHLMTHAFFKALLFLAAGSVMHAMSGELDMRKMGGLWHKMRTTAITFLIATLAISGVPMFAGFFSKDEILAGAYGGPLGKAWLYWLGTITAGLTAFYMFRAVFMTFFGESRVPPELEPHVHESGRKMTVPLIVLAFFSVVIGYLSWPKPLGGSEGFDRYLEPVFGDSEAFLRSTVAHAEAGGLSDGALMAISLLAASIGIALAYWFYGASPGLPDRIADRFRGLYQTLVHKYYIDEFYDWLVVTPLRVGSEKVLWHEIDEAVIDGGMVEGTAEATGRVGNVVRRMQSGYVRNYAVWVVVGAAVWLGYVLFHG